MRAREFLQEDDPAVEPINQYSDVLMVLGQIQREIKEKNLKSEVPTSMVINYVKNAGLKTFDYNDLVKANEELPAMKEMLKNIDPKKITFVTGSEETVKNTQDYSKDAVANPEQTVSNMAKSALKRRQD